MNKILRTPPPNIIQAALDISLEGDCDRLGVGAVVWDLHNNVVSSGCNRAPKHFKNNCRDNGHLMVDGHCVRTAHAETTAIMNICGPVTGNLIHITHTPCPHCIKLIIEAGILQITWSEDYGNAKGAMAVLKESSLFWGRV